MDLSTAGGALVITVFRLLHIIAGMIWIGSAIMLSMYIEPVLARSGVDTRKFLSHLYGKSGFDKLMPAVAILTTVAGLVLYYLVTNGFSDSGFMRSGQGIVLSIGALFGLLAFGHGGGALGPMTGKYNKLVQEAGDNPTDEQNAALTAMEAKLSRHGKISMWLAVIALVFMAGARYVNPIL